MKSIPYIFHDIQESQMYALAQAAGRAGFSVHATEQYETSWAKHSVYLDACVENSSISEVGSVRFAASFKHLKLQGVILTCLDDVALFLARYETLLKDIGLQFITASEQNIQRVSDLNQMPELGDLNVLRSQFLTEQELYDASETLDYPIIIKSSRNQFCKFENTAELHQFFATHDLPTYIDEQYRIQKYIAGDVPKMATAILLFDEQGHCVRGFTGRRTAVNQTQFGPFGETMAAKAEWIPELYEGARDMLTHIGWKGFAEVECKQDVQGQWHVLEINPRLSGWACVAEADGAGFLQAYHEICTSDAKLQEACLQRSNTEYMRLISTGSHATYWSEYPSKWQKLKALYHIYTTYKKQKPNISLGAWDDHDFKASFSLFLHTLARHWKL
jgi:predicted ATP-grasp superfamily ATP-dependent carboligase